MKNHIRLLLLLIIGFVLNSVYSQADQKSTVSGATSELFVDRPQSLITASKQITFAGPRSGEGYFSADGKKMVFQSEREDGNPFYQMFVLDLESGKTVRVSPGTGMTTCGWIHPGLKKMMWSSTHLDKNFSDKVKAEYEERAKPVKRRYSWSYDDQYDIFESDLSGRQLKRLTRELGYDAEGSYSPDGKLIAFASNRSRYSDPFSDDEKKILEQDPAYAMEIYVMKADGSGVKRLTTSKGYDGGPFFSADGKKIIWRRFTPDGSRAEIFTMNVDGTDQAQITRLNAMSWAPFFHPSGEYVIFSTSVLGYSNFELFIVDSEGLGKPVRVTTADGFDGLASFSPDGKKITWTHRNEKGESQIYLADWDHQQALNLVRSNLPEKKETLTLNPEINEQDARQIVRYLASESFKGRMTGSAEEKAYADEIARNFKSWGLVPAIGKSFIQTFEFTSAVSAGPENSLDLKGRFESSLKRGVDYQVVSYSKSGAFREAPLVFAGYGIKAPATDKLPAFDSYLGLDVKDKWVVLLEHLPDHPSKEMKQHLLSYSRPQHKVTVAKNNNAVGVVIVSDTGLKDLRYEGSLSESTLPVLRMSTQAFSKMLARSDSVFKSFAQLESDFDTLRTSEGFNLNSQYLGAKIDLVQVRSTGRNVIGKLPVAGKTRGVLIGAHGDHLGLGSFSGSSLARADEKDKTHYGADDNASGVAGVLELAHHYSKNKTKLKKPLYFAVWSGEEIGVLGSGHFAKTWRAENKADLKQSLEANLNMDMIGRLREKLQVQGVASAKEWAGLGEEVGLVSGVPLVLTNDPYLPTDSMSFYLAEIPAISFFTGTHEEYHSPRDTYETLNYSGLVKVIGIVKSFTDRIATVSAPVVKYEKVESAGSQKLEGRSFRIYLGTIPDYSQEGIKGVRISGVSKNSPAEKASLKTGDVIVEFDKTNIENLYDYVYALQSAKPNQTVKLSIFRDGKRLELQITPVVKE